MKELGATADVLDHANKNTETFLKVEKLLLSTKLRKLAETSGSPVRFIELEFAILKVQYEKKIWHI